jgi:hypothetical protein
LFVAGELETISSSSIDNSERVARIALLKKLMYLCSSYDFVVVKSLYAALVREIELGHIEWGDSFQYVETSVLSSHIVKKKELSSIILVEWKRVNQTMLKKYGFVAIIREINACKSHHT